MTHSIFSWKHKPSITNKVKGRTNMLVRFIGVMLLSLVSHAGLATVQLPHGQYHLNVTDLHVKVMGGFVQVKRTWYKNQWHFNRVWNPLGLTLDSTGGVSNIERNDELYSFTAEHATSSYSWSTGPVTGYRVYSFDKQKRIIQTSSGYRWEKRNGDWIEYDNNGRILRYGDRNQVEVSFIYDNLATSATFDKLTGIADHIGTQVLWYEYDTNGQISAVRDHSDLLQARRVVYGYGDGLSRPVNLLLKVTDVLGYDWLYDYDTSGSAVSTITDPELNTTHILYKPSGRVASVKRADGSGVNYDYSYDTVKKQFYVRLLSNGGKNIERWYNQNGLQIREDIAGQTVSTMVLEGRKRISSSRNGHQTIREYDEWQRLVRITYPDLSSETIEYENTFSRITRSVDPNGVISEFSYDSKGNHTGTIAAKNLPEERVIEYGYDIYGNRTSAKLVADLTSTPTTAEALSEFAYDARGNLTTFTDAERHVTTYSEYDQIGNPWLITDARIKPWRKTYNDAGWLLSVSDPLIHTVNYDYDKVGNRTKITTARGKITQLVYDDNYSLKAIIDPYNNSYSYTYDTDYRLKQEQDEELRAVNFEYDSAGRPVKTINGNGDIVSISYKDDGSPDAGAFAQPHTVTYPTYQRIYQYDNRNRRIRNTALVGTEGNVHGMSYDAVSNIIAYTDANGKATYYDFDGHNRQIKLTNALKDTKNAVYDDQGNIRQVEDAAKRLHRFEYDRLGQLVKEFRPLGQTTTYSYDENGNPLTKIDPLGQKTEFVYDDAGRLHFRKLYVASDLLTPVQTVTFGYDNDDNLTSWGDGVFSGTASYDDLSRKTGETVNYGTFSLSYSYTYYKNSYVQSFTGPDNIAYNYTYDNNNQLLSVGIPGQGAVTVNAYQWAAATRITLPGGASREAQFTGLLEPLSITVKDPGLNVLAQLDFQYGKMRNLSSKGTKDGDFSYGYDDLYRLKNADHTLKDNEGFDYDPVGNRIATQVNGVAEGVQWTYNDNDEIQTQGGFSYAHNANGNLRQRQSTDGTQNFFYDVLNRLIKVTDLAGAIIAEYGYDPFDRRLWKEVAGVRSYYFYSLEGLVGEFDSNGVQQVSYLYYPGRIWGTDPLFQKNADGYFYYHNDHLGTPHKMTAANGAVVWSADYDAYGDASIALSSTLTSNLRFPGQYYDAETGLHYNYRRYYDPATGRYLSLDPIGTTGQNNLYTYAKANPINYIDPTGECALGGIAIGRGIAEAEALITGGCVDYGGWDYVLDGLCIGPVVKGVKYGVKYGPKLLDKAVDKAIDLGRKIGDKAGELLDVAMKQGGKVLDGIGAGLNKIKCKLFNSFSGDTLVHTRTGLVPINTLKVGDEVLSYAEWNGKRSYQKVEAVITGEKVYELVVLTLVNGETVKATAGHPMYLHGQGWRDAEKLVAGDLLYRQDKGSLRIKSIKRQTRQEKVYNLTVANTRTYYVGEVGVLVHNANSVGSRSGKHLMSNYLIMLV